MKGASEEAEFAQFGFAKQEGQRSRASFHFAATHSGRGISHRRQEGFNFLRSLWLRLLRNRDAESKEDTKSPQPAPKACMELRRLVVEARHPQFGGKPIAVDRPQPQGERNENKAEQTNRGFDCVFHT
jgi:hypothetical protein